MNESRQVLELLDARTTSDGDGVKLLRVFGGGDLARFDPFLMLDEFGSYDASDYIGGFPSHPHRGFETVTYMLEGEMEHLDHMDNIGVIGPGDVQWMKAGAGVIHSEMPRQQEGRMRGFQLWINLPATEKMTPATYEDIASDKIPQYRIKNIVVKAIAGNFQIDGVDVSGSVTDRSTRPGYLDINFAHDGAELSISVPDDHIALLYVYEGEVMVGSSGSEVSARQLARLSGQGPVALKGDSQSKALLMTGKPIGEPIVQRGPFVMNTEAEIQRAIEDYKQGKLLD
ncbi:MAG: pirin family protein [Gammaproteobacteria bacterium]|nr:pirin family protein [Gammaproteobacteria bacterium]